VDSNKATAATCHVQVAVLPNSRWSTGHTAEAGGPYDESF